MRIVLNATPLAFPGTSFHAAVDSALAFLVDAGEVERVVLHIATVRPVDTSRLAHASPKTSVRRHFLPAAALERFGAWNRFRAENLFPGADVYWNTHHMYPAPVSATGRVVTTVHGCSPVVLPPVASTETRDEYARRFDRLRNRSGLIHAVSGAVRDELAGQLGFDEKRIRVRHNPVDPAFQPGEADRALLQNKYGIRGGYVLAVGSTGAVKNHVRLVRAWERIAGDFPGLSLAIAGHRQFGAGEVDRAIEGSSVKSSIRVLGPVPHPSATSDLVHLYRGARLLVQPSLYEGCCLTTMEAIACGTPVAASGIPSLRECLGGGGAYFDPLDEAGMAAAISSLLSDDSLGTDLVRRAQPALIRHSIRHCGEEMLTILREAARDH